MSRVKGVGRGYVRPSVCLLVCPFSVSLQLFHLPTMQRVFSEDSDNNPRCGVVLQALRLPGEQLYGGEGARCVCVCARLF